MELNHQKVCGMLVAVVSLCFVVGSSSASAQCAGAAQCNKKVDMRTEIYKSLTAVPVSFPTSQDEDKDGVMTAEYWKIWNYEIQKMIDADIDKYRKTNVDIDLSDKKIKKGTKIKVELLVGDVWFGAHIFNYNQLGNHEANERFKSIWGNLFTSATVAFYWKNFETEPGRLRFREEYWDTEEWWNKQDDPYKYHHWRRPASDPVVNFLKERGVRIQGHCLIWGNRGGSTPVWYADALLDSNEYKTFRRLTDFSPYSWEFVGNGKDNTPWKKEFKDMTVEQVEDSFPHLARIYWNFLDRHIRDIADYYKDGVEAWDVVNESAQDLLKGYSMNVGGKLMKSHYGIMPADFTFKSFQTANEVFPKSVKLIINDWENGPTYVNQVKDLLVRGCRIDYIGSQMHLFRPKQCSDIAMGAQIETPEQEWKKLALLSQTGLPIHLSEITITAPNDDTRGRLIQAVIAYNLYRLWFSTEKMAGITWWNSVDGCASKNEPSTSGLFTRDMQPKPSFFALDRLINHEWKTNIERAADNDGHLRFRGFKGTYRISWTDRKGNTQSMEYTAK